MWKVLIVLVLVGRASCQWFPLPGLEEYENPYLGNFLFGNRPGQIIRQHHGRCQTTNGATQEGICVTRPECSLSGGQPQGRQSCLLGTCCVYSRGCSQITNQRVSYFEGTNTVNNNNNECIYRVRAESANVCQMRLDFDSLNFPQPRRLRLPADPTTNIAQEIGPYTCLDTFFQVESPNNRRIPILCGDNDGQHIYVPVNASRGERELVLKIVTNNNPASWRIKITQLECPSLGKHQKASRVWEDSQLIAPDGCLQYYQETSRTIRNLGYEQNSLLASNHYQAGLYYATCFRRTNDMCGIDFTVNNFQVGNGDPDGANGETTNANPCTRNIMVGGSVGGDGTEIPIDTDFLFIPNGILTTVPAGDTGGGGGGGVTGPTIIYKDRYCGALRANSLIRSVTPGPFYIFFKTDNQVLLDTTNIDPPPTGSTTVDGENGWELTYTTLFGTSCGV